MNSTLIKKLLLHLFITLVVGINCIYSMEEYDLEAQLIPFQYERDDKDQEFLSDRFFSTLDDISKNSLDDLHNDVEVPSLFNNNKQRKKEDKTAIGAYDKLKFGFLDIYSFCTSFIKGKKTDTLSELIQELPAEMVAHILSFIPPRDIGLNCFIRHVEYMEESPFKSIADRIKEEHHKYVLKKCANIMNLGGKRYFKKLRKKRKIAESVLSFMATTKNNDYFWTPSYLLNYLIPEYNPKTGLVLDYDQIYKSVQNYLKQIVNIFKILQSRETGIRNKEELSYQYLKVHLQVLNILSDRLVRYPYFNNDKITYFCCNGSKCVVGPVDCKDAENFCTKTSMCVCSFGTAFLLFFGLANAPWYYFAIDGCISVSSLTVPCCLQQYIACENKKYENEYHEVGDVFHLLSSAGKELENFLKIQYEQEQGSKLEKID